LRQTIVSRLSSTLASSGIGVLDLAAQQSTIAAGLAGTLTEDLAPFGIQVAKFIIENISLPPEVEAAVDKRTQMAIVGDLDAYTRFQSANAIEDAANNPGGAGDGVGLGVGLAVGQRVAAGLAPTTGAVPPPLPTQPRWCVGVSGDGRGPFDIETLARRGAGGDLAEPPLVGRWGMANGRPAWDVPRAAALLGAVPPPLPPQSPAPPSASQS